MLILVLTCKRINFNFAQLKRCCCRQHVDRNISSKQWSVVTLEMSYCSVCPRSAVLVASLEIKYHSHVINISLTIRISSRKFPRVLSKSKLGRQKGELAKTLSPMSFGQLTWKFAGLKCGSVKSLPTPIMKSLLVWPRCVIEKEEST